MWIFWFLLNFSIVDLQCFRCSAWYIYIYIILQIFSIIGYYKMLNIVPYVICNRSLSIFWNLCFILEYSWLTMLLVSGVQWSDSVIHTHTSILFQILFPFMLFWNISLCCTVSPCWLSVLNIVVCICQSQTPNLSPSPPFLFDNHQVFFYVCESVSIF